MSAGHDLANKFLLGLHHLVEIGVERTLGDVCKYAHGRVFVALAHDAPLSLLEVGGPPWTIEMVECDEPLLDVRTRAHFKCGADEHPHLSGIDLAEQRLLLPFCLGRVDEGNFIIWNTSGDKLVFEVIIDVKAVSRRREWR